jgi:hypothetical protein
MIRKLLLGLSILCLPTARVHAQESLPLSEAAVAGWMGRVRPELEKALGYPLPKLPKYQFASAALLRRLPDPCAADYLHWRFPHLQEEALARALEDAEAVSASATLARLAEGSDVILVRPKNRGVIAGWDRSLQAADSVDFLLLALIHETVHFALDQRFDLKKRRQACHDSEERLALQVLTEGRCQWVTRQLARRLGKEPLFWLLAERFAHVPDISTDAAHRAMSQSLMGHHYWSHTEGLALFTNLEDRAIPDVEKAVFNRPPKSLEGIKALFSRRIEASHQTDLATALGRLQKALPPADWSATQQSWTRSMVSQVADLVGERGHAEKVLERWLEGRSLVWTLKSNPGRQVALSLATFQSPAAARAYFNFIQDLQRKRDEISNGAGALPGRVLESRRRAVRLPGMEEAVENDKTIQLAGATPVGVLLARGGVTVVEITWYGNRADLGWAESALKLLHDSADPVRPGDR